MQTNHVAAIAPEPPQAVAPPRRFDLLRDCDLLVAPHHHTLETRLSLRTRFLDAFALGMPVVVSSGGAVATLVHDAGAGWVAPAGDAKALAGILAAAIERRGAVMSLSTVVTYIGVLVGAAAMGPVFERSGFSTVTTFSAACLALAAAAGVWLSRILRTPSPSG